MNIADFQPSSGSAMDADVLFRFAGEFTPAAISEQAAALRARLDALGLRSGLKRRLFSAFVELAQNVAHYASATTPGDGRGDVAGVGRGLIAVGLSGDHYWVVSGNLVPSEASPWLSERLDAIRALTPIEIQARYRSQLDNDAHGATDALSKGAGLGLLTVARHSSRPLEFQLTPLAAAQGHCWTCFSVCARLDIAETARTHP